MLRKGLRWAAVGFAAVVVLIGIALGVWWYQGQRARAALLEQPVYRVLDAHEPALFQELLMRYRQFRNGETREAEFVNVANARITEAATGALAHASQESVLALVTDMVATARKLQSAPGDSCFRYWFPTVSGPPDVAAVLDAGAQAHTLTLMGEVIRSAAENPVALPDTGDVEDNLARVINETYEEFGSDAQMLAHTTDPRIDRARVCTITLYLYDRILRLPPEQASALIRVMTQADTGGAG
jgi:hypothetical protein